MKQPFDWLEPKVSAAYAASFPAKRREALERELEERAAMLMRLGYSPHEIKVRLRAHLEFDDAEQELVRRVDEIVDRVETRRGGTKHGAPPLE